MSAIRVVQQTVIYRGRVVRVLREVLEIEGRRMVRETIQHPGAVVIVPLLERSRLVFVRQYRRAIRRELLELPAGTLAVGESPVACARRELQEETGWRARSMRCLGQFFAAPGVLSEQMTVFLARNLHQAAARPEPDELITPVVLSLRQALRRIESGAIRDAKTIIGVLFADAVLHRRRR